MQNKLINKLPLLNKKGNLLQKGYAFRYNIIYNRENCKSKIKIKEWDFYQILNDKFCLQLTIGHVSYASSVSCTLIELQSGKRYSITKMGAFPLNKMGMPDNPEKSGTLSYAKKNFNMTFTKAEDKRILLFNATDKTGIEFAVNIVIENADTDAMVIATPFLNKTDFYLNYKLNCMKCSGEIKINGTDYNVSDNTFAVLDWGRGIWPFSHQWYWGNGSTVLPDGRKFGFNIGWGFGNTADATENMLFVDGVGQKLEHIFLTKASYMSNWQFTSSDNRFNMTFSPLYDNFTQTKMLFVNNACHQVFGYFNGNVTLDNGEVLNISNMLAFCEHASNNW